MLITVTIHNVAPAIVLVAVTKALAVFVSVASVGIEQEFKLLEPEIRVYPKLNVSHKVLLQSDLKNIWPKRNNLTM